MKYSAIAGFVAAAMFATAGIALAVSQKEQPDIQTSISAFNSDSGVLPFALEARQQAVDGKAPDLQLQEWGGRDANNAETVPKDSSARARGDAWFNQVRAFEPGN